MNTQEAIKFLENDILTISIIDQSVEEYYEKIKGVISLLRRGEKYEAIYNEIWEHFEFSPTKELLHMNYEDFVKLLIKLNQKYFPKESDKVDGSKDK